MSKTSGRGRQGWSMIALAVHQGEIFGMGRKIGLPGDELLEGVDVVAGAVEVAGIVEPHPVAIVGVEGELAVDDADLVHRILGLEEAAEGEIVRGGKDLGRGAEAPAAEIFFEEVDDAVDDAPAAPPET